MKGLLVKSSLILTVVVMCFAGTAFAKHSDKMMMMKKMKWMCETNASSATTDADKKADEMMSKKAMSAHDAFGFAMKHCRDCTKITCTAQDMSNMNNTNNMNNSNMNMQSPSTDTMKND